MNTARESNGRLWEEQETDLTTNILFPTPNENSSLLMQTQTFTVYRKRWLILILYSIFSISSIIQCKQYSVVATIAAKYYSAVDGTSNVVSLVRIIFTIPGIYFLDKMGLRISVLIGITGTCIGSWINAIAVNPTSFWLVLFCQFFTEIFQVLVLIILPKLAAVWFGENEISWACTLGVIAIQISSAVGYILPELLIEESGMETMHTGFNQMAFGIAIFTTVSAVLIIFFFEDAPPTAPSAAQLKMQENKKQTSDFKNTLKSLLLKNNSFLFLLIPYGIHGGVAISLPGLLDQIIVSDYPGSPQDIGILGFLMIFCGMIGSLIYGMLLTNFSRLKLITLFSYIGCTLSTFLFLFLLDQKLIVVYMLGIMLSIFWGITFNIGLEVSAEITYPEPEAASGGLLINFYQLCSIIITYVYSFACKEFGNFLGNIILVTILLLANVFLFFINFDLKRSEVNSPKKVIGYNATTDEPHLYDHDSKNENQKYLNSFC